MTEPASSLPWAQPGWREDAEAWIRGEVARQGVKIAGPITQPHIRPWSTVLHVPAEPEDVYFKATAAATAHEPGLTVRLAAWRPDCMPVVMAVDPGRGWLLTRDMGAMLRALINSPEDGIRRWALVLPVYAGVQIDMIGRRDEILALGPLDRRLATLPKQYERLLDDTEMLRVGLPDGLAAGEYERLRELAPRFAGMCARLADYGIPETLHHDDFHDGNVFVHGGRYILSDWAESGIAHPFCTLVVALRSIAYRLGLDEDGPEIAGLREAYLEPWAGYGSHADLLAACEVARRVGRVCRALTWYQILKPLPGAERAEHADAVPGWLQIFLEGEAE